MTFSRQTCFFFDSSSGFTILRAVFDDGRSMRLIERTCDIGSNETIRFDRNDGVTEPPSSAQVPEPERRACAGEGLPMEENAARRFAAAQKEERASRESERTRSGSSSGNGMGDLGVAYALTVVTVGALGLAIPDYAYRFSSARGMHGVSWELPVETPLGGADMALGLNVGLAYFPGPGATVGKAELRFWPLYHPRGLLDLGVAAGGFIGDGAGPRGEVRVRVHPIGAELWFLSLFVAQAYEYDVRNTRHLGQTSVGIEIPITVGGGG
jgi:hypothetical protein